MTEGATIRFEPAGRTITVSSGSTLLEAARAAGVQIDAPCGGAGTCGSCRVLAEGALEPPTPGELELLGGAGFAAGKRLACKARVRGDVTVTVPEPPKGACAVTSANERALAVEPPGARGIEAIGTVAGLAIDIGTTTLAVSLLDLKTGRTLATVGDLNPQRAFGADVLSRVAHAAAGGAPELQRLMVEQLESMASVALEEAGLSADRLAEAVVVGNVAMTGLLLGEDVAMLGEAPYEGAPLAARRVIAAEIGARALASLEVHVLPGISAFIGSDITADLLATGLADRAEPTLLIDLGTNGEIVLQTGQRLLAVSTAAGPALEGASIECGMRAAPGAIERVGMADDDIELGVIGDREPVGICGSGLLDIVALLLDEGLLDRGGAFAARPEGPLGDRFAERNGVRAFELDRESGIALTQKDVRQVQLAVGAVRAGISLLLEEAGLDVGDVTSVIVAGGFGYHVRVTSLVRLGLLPSAWQERVTFGGNTALTGARMALVSSAERARAGRIASQVRTIDLAAHAEFQERFLASLAFPG